MKKDIIVIGGGGHCKVVIDAILNIGIYNIRGIVDNKLEPESKVLGISVIGNDDCLPALFKQGIINAFMGVGSVGDCNLRRRLYEKVKTLGFSFPVIVHPQAVVARDVMIGEGTFVAAGAVINPGTIIGKNVIINTRSSIDHDCMISDFVHVAPGVTLSGGIEIGEATHIGTGAKVRQYVKIAKNCLVKMGTIVTRDISDE